MRRLLQFGTLFFILMTFLAPLAECLDRWDPAGLSNDTEFAVLAVLFALSLVLLVSKLVSLLAQSIHLAATACDQPPDAFDRRRCEAALELIAPPLLSPPLRI